MKSLSAQDLAGILGGTIAAGDPQAMIVAGVTTDSRRVERGAAFFALRGERFDGDQFAAAALQAGAAVAVVVRWQGGELPAGTAVIEVADPLLALQKLACWWRRQLDLPVVAITGSNGKTSTKDLTAAVLGRIHRVCATRGNLNNHIGVPLSVLSAGPDHGAAVWEMGMNHSGEIAPLCEIARPRYGIITNIGTAHIEFLGSRDAIAEEKGALARALPEDGILFLPATCDYHSYLRQRTRASIVSVGNGRGAVRAEQPVFEAGRTIFQLVIDGAGSVGIELPLAGRHMVTNALLAAATGWKLGVPLEQIAAGLAEVKLTSGRLRRYRSGEVEIIDDTYNANPESMIAAIDTLAELPASGRRFIVLGRMGELGKYAAEGHLKVGRHAKARGLHLLAVGEGAQGIAEGGGAPHLESFDQAAGWLRSEVRPGDVVLFKGSRLAAVDTLMNSVFPPS